MPKRGNQKARRRRLLCGQSPPSPLCSIDALPDEVLLCILEFVPDRGLCRCMLVCRRLRAVAVTADRNRRWLRTLPCFLCLRGDLAAVRHVYYRRRPLFDDRCMTYAASGGHADVVAFLCGRKQVVSGNAVRNAIAGGHVGVLRAILASGARIHPPTPVTKSWNDALAGGHAKALALLCDEPALNGNTVMQPCKPPIGARLAAKGMLGVVRVLYERGLYRCDGDAANKAVKAGRTKVAAFLVRSGLCRLWPLSSDVRAMAKRGRLSALEFVDRTATGFLRSKAACESIREAAAHGHLAVVRFFCRRLAASDWAQSTSVAVEAAAAAGHLPVVRWLTEERRRRGKVCTREAFDAAAAGGHLHVARWLHHSARGVDPTSDRSIGFTCDAMRRAAASGHTDLLAFLHDSGDGGCVLDALVAAGASGHVGALLWAIDNVGPHCTVCGQHDDAAIRNAMVDTAVGAARGSHADALQLVVTRMRAFLTEDAIVDVVVAVARSGYARTMSVLDRHGLVGAQAVTRAWCRLDREQEGHHRLLVDVCRRAQVSQLVQVLAGIEAVQRANRIHADDASEPPNDASGVAHAIARYGRRLTLVAGLLVALALALGAVVLWAVLLAVLSLFGLFVDRQRAVAFAALAVAVQGLALAIVLGAARRVNVWPFDGLP